MKRIVITVCMAVIFTITCVGACASSLTPEQQLNAYYSLFAINMGFGEYEAALNDIEKCFEYMELANDTLKADLNLKRGYTLVILNRPDESVAYLKACLEIAPDTADAMLLLMQVYAQTGQTETAFKQADDFISYYPELTDVYSTLGELLSAQADFENSIRAFTLYIENTESALPEVYTLRGQSYLQTGKYLEAIADLTVSIDNAPDTSLRASYLRGVAYMQIGDYENAVLDMAACVSAIDTVKLYETDQSADDENIANIAAQIDIDIANSRYYYGIALMQLGRNAEAIQAFSGCVDEGLLVNEATFWRGNCHLEAQDYVSAAKDFEASMQAGMEADSCLYYLGVCAMGTAEYEKAVELFTRCLDGDIMADQARYNRGMCYMQIGENEKAAADLKAAIGTGG